MKKMIIAAICMLLLVPFVSAHAIEKGPVIKNTEQYTIEFSAEPKFPVTSRTTHIDFVIKDKEGIPVSDLDINIEVHEDKEIVRLLLQERERGHYSAEYRFNKAGKHDIHIFVRNKELETRFALEVDNFGLSGTLRLLTIIFLIEILIIKAFFDCKKRKNN